MPPSTSAEISSIKSIQAEVQKLPAGSFERKERGRSYDGFFSVILLAAFVVFVIVKVFSPRKFNQMFAAFIKPTAMNQLLREEYAFSNRSSILLLALYLLMAPLFTLQAASHFMHDTFLTGFNPSKALTAYLLFLSLIFMCYVFKISTVRILSSVFNMKSAGSEYIYTILLFNKVAGLILFPLVLLIAFARQLNQGFFLYVGFVLLVILLIYRMLRLIQMGLTNSGVSILYLFLYLCTLEILPLVVLIKLFMFIFL